jgi:hypothetical protein
MNYIDAVKMVKGKSSAGRRKIGNNTYATIQPDGSVTIRLHSTDVVTIYPDDAVKVNSGGWRTSTTKDRINKYSPVGVYQRNHQWYFDDGTRFEDNTIFKMVTFTI